MALFRKIRRYFEKRSATAAYEDHLSLVFVSLAEDCRWLAAIPVVSDLANDYLRMLLERSKAGDCAESVLSSLKTEANSDYTLTTGDPKAQLFCQRYVDFLCPDWGSKVHAHASDFRNTLAALDQDLA